MGGIEPEFEELVGLLYDTSGKFNRKLLPPSAVCPAITVGVDALDSYHFQILYRRISEEEAMDLILKANFAGDALAVDLENAPLPTLTAGGLSAMNRGEYWLESGGAARAISRRRRAHVQVDKPPYRVPLMAEIGSLPANGYRVVSTFSGCGGSCLGFKLDGYRVLWASEFIDAAAETYLANHPGVHLDRRDIREVKGADVLEAIGLERGEVDVLEGSPPCASFSTSGRREESWGKVKAYSDKKQRVDDLFFEYVRLVQEIQPKVFVAENVSGLVKGKAKGYFLEILRDMKAAGYEVESRLLDAQWLGVPQQRARIIFVGVRQDLVERYGVRPTFPKPLPYRYSVADACPWIRRVQFAGSTYNGEPFPRWRTSEEPSDPIMASGATISPTAYWSGGTYIEAEELPLAPEEIGTDLARYATGREADKLREGEQSAKYFNLIRAHRDAPYPTVTTAEGVVRGAATVIHPVERRKFSIPELRRICGFPDDFVLTGSYAQRWERLGRAVPPPMMYHLAQVIRTEILDKCVD